ncbi:MAG: YcgN family cysteine cluster protein [bacterium]
MTDRPFWECKTLSDMNREEWESLCDGCAKCCLVKLEDEDSGEIHYTKVVCKLLDQENCRCTNYAERNKLVPECLWLTPAHLDELEWLPTTCAYRLLHEGKPLPDWHPLISGNPDSVHEAGISVRGRVLSEEFVHPDGLEEHIVRWVE